MSRFYEIGRSNQKTFLTKNVGNDEKPKPYFMTSWPKMLHDLITRQFALKLEHTSYISLFCWPHESAEKERARSLFFPSSQYSNQHSILLSVRCLRLGV